ncbi:L-fucose:H+ symporter permease [Phaeodactylibacter xiamenensis]|uniref:L-fucose:H+ symporter permease n=1 Tax=Phaeodactylibacter xiamenensis TaxID=1524460 RepID=UPI0024A9BA3B|nr:L-fucose:H+ symporter permease [Phaeodactylibacter xiamenensis]
MKKNPHLIPFILVTSLFFLWGLANILNSALISHFQPVFDISRAQALLVETAFYLGYFTIAVPAGLYMEKYTYKKGIILGLLLYAIGALLFIPAAKMLTFAFFLLALYVIASGLAFLETAANPYVTILGPKENATQRLNFAQSFNGVALVVGPYLAGMLIFSGNEGDMATQEAKLQAANAVVVPYVGIAIAVLIVAFLIWRTQMPEPDKGDKLKFDPVIFKFRHLMLAVLAQLLYVGAQAGLWGITIDFVTEMMPGVSKEVASGAYLVAGTLLFVIGRFIGTFLMSYIKDSTLLGVYGLIAAGLCMMGIMLGGAAAVYAILAVNFFMSIMFPTIFGLGVRDLGKHTKLGSSFIIMAIVGGAVFPPIMGILSESFSIQASFWIPVVSFLFVAFYGFRGYMHPKGFVAAE